MMRKVSRTALVIVCVALLFPGCGSKSKVITLTSRNFDEIVLAGTRPVLVDFGAEWCQPCKAMDPLIRELAGEFEGKAVVGKVDADENPELSKIYQVMYLPTFIVFKDGKEIRRYEKAVPKELLANALGAFP